MTTKSDTKTETTAKAPVLPFEALNRRMAQAVDDFAASKFGKTRVMAKAPAASDAA